MGLLVDYERHAAMACDVDHERCIHRGCAAQQADYDVAVFDGESGCPPGMEVEACSGPSAKAFRRAVNEPLGAV